MGWERERSRGWCSTSTPADRKPQHEVVTDRIPLVGVEASCMLQTQPLSVSALLHKIWSTFGVYLAFLY